jgi:hypothetical protein
MTDSVKNIDRTELPLSTCHEKFCLSVVHAMNVRNWGKAPDGEPRHRNDDGSHGRHEERWADEVRRPAITAPGEKCRQMGKFVTKRWNLSVS